jgi:hypothetical protein
MCAIVTHPLQGHERVSECAPKLEFRLKMILYPRLTAAVAALALASVSAAPAAASVTFYTTQATYDAALALQSTTVSTFNFNAVPLTSYDTASGLTVDGVNFVGNNGNGGYYLNPTPAYYCCDDYNNPNETIQLPAINSSYYGVTNGYTAITFAKPTTAFSFDAYTVEAGDYGGDGADTLNLTVGGSTGQTVTLPQSTTGFLGFISTTPVTSATLTGSTDEDFIDMVDGSVAGGIPEPAAWALLLLGFAGAGAHLRVARSRRAPA